MQVFRLVALAGCARLDVVLNHLAKIGGVEVATQTVKGPLDPFMAIIMDGGQELGEEC